MKNQTILAYAKEIAEPGASSERIDEIAHLLSLFIYSAVCAAGNRVFEAAREWEL